MSKLYTKFISSKLYLLLLLGWLGTGTTSCSTVYYSPSGGTFSGQTTYCAGAPSNDSFVYTQCMGGSTGILGTTYLGASGTVQWYYNTTGSTTIASSTALGSAVAFSSSSTGANGAVTYSPPTLVAGTNYYFADFEWSGSGYCATSFITSAQMITVDPAIALITGGASSICAGTSTLFSDTEPGGVWTSSNPSVASISATGNVMGLSAGSTTISFTAGCTLTTALTVNFSPPTPYVAPATASICSGGGVAFTATVGPTFTDIVPANSFEGSVPGSGWTATGADASYIFQTDAPGSVDPSVAAAEDGSYFLEFDSYDVTTGNGNYLSPTFSLVGVSGLVITAWVYRDYGSGFTTGYETEGMTVEINNATAIAGATVLGFVPRDASTPTTGSYITGASTTTSSQWQQYTFTVPASFAGYGTAVNKVFLHFHTDYGDNCYTDNVTIKGFAPTAGPVWSPATYLFTDAAFTTPYIAGTPEDTVYANPTGLTASTVEVYTATETAGTCATLDTAVLNISVPTATIGGATALCYGGNANVTFAGPAGAAVSYNVAGGTTYTVALSAAGTASVSTGTLYASTTYNILGVVTAGCSATLTGSATITVNPPTAIDGDSSICTTFSSTLSGSPSGGTWTSSAPSVASIGVSSGVLTGIAVGTTTVTYTAPSTGCISTTTATVNLSPTIYSITNGGTTDVCFGALGIDLHLLSSQTGVSYQLYNGASAVGGPLAGTGANLDFGYITTTGSFYVMGTNTVTGCSISMADTANVLITDLPVAYTVTGGGAYCSGGAGFDLGLSSSTSGINYQLYDGASTIGSSIAGTGSALNFGIQSAAGVYTVLATSAATACTNSMSGSATIVVNPLPVVYNVTGGGNYCHFGSGVHVQLSGSATGINYQLYNGATSVGSAMAGTGSAIDFGLQTGVGVYTVLATNATTLCTNAMALSATVDTLSLPVVYNVSSGGDYCSGGTGVSITLSGSDVGISYQLYNGASLVGSPLAGTGSGLNFGMYIPSGSYPVVATNTATGCASSMSGSATIVIDPLPNLYSVTGGGSYCIGGTGVAVGLSGSDAGVNYQLFNGSSATGTPVAGTGSTISFGSQTAAGTYTVLATNAATGCLNNMVGSVTVIVNVLVYDSVSINVGPVDTVCTGTSVHFVANTIGGGSAPTYHWTVDGSAVGSTDNTYDFIPTDGNIIQVTMTSSIPCAVPVSPVYATTVTVLPYGIPVAHITSDPVDSVCEGYTMTFTPTDSFGGYHPVYAWVVNGVLNAVSPTFTYIPLNHDSVSAVVTSDYACRLADSGASAKLIVTVHPLLIPNVNIIAVPSVVLGFGQTDTLVAVVTNGGTHPLYQWYINDTMQVGETRDTLVTGDLKNKDSVSCVVLNNGVCAGIQTFSWRIISEYPLGIQQVSLAGSDIRLLPNPNKGAFTIKGNWAITNDDDVSVQVTDMLGQVVYNGSVTTLQGQMEGHITLGNTMTSGVYLLSLHRGAETKIFHFVIEQ